VGVFQVDPQTGTLRAIQVLIDGQDGCEALEGAFRVTTSPKGEHVYVCSGRFGGDQAVTVFARQGDGTLELVEEHVNDTDNFTDFKGGNGLGVSPDGTYLYALATESDRIATFARDAKTGKLTFRRIEIVGDEVAPGCPTLCFSPDGKFLYVADENANAIVVYRMP
jgi:6-phosphogluconolactonase (cycloisomerase 2 family)